MSLKIESVSSPESENLIRIFLKDQRSGVLATADSAANPYGAVVYFMLDDDFSVLFGTKRETQKFKNMEENRQAALVVYDEATQTTAQIVGHVEFPEDDETREKVMSNFSKASIEGSSNETAPSEKIIAGDYAVVRINPSVIKFAEYGFAKPGGEDLFETIIFSGN